MASVAATSPGIVSTSTLATTGLRPVSCDHAVIAATAWTPTRVRTTIGLSEAAERFCAPHGVSLEVRQESATPEVRFDEGLRAAIAAVIGDVPVLATGAGHDAGVLAARVPAAMLFVRNPTGVSHSPQEHASLADCEHAVTALAAVLAELTR